MINLTLISKPIWSFQILTGSEMGVAVGNTTKGKKNLNKKDFLLWAETEKQEASLVNIC